MKFISIFFLIGFISAQNCLQGSEKKYHELYWEDCIGREIPWEKYTSWLGTENDDSRIAVRNHLAKQEYHSLLDAACGLCIDYFGFKNSGISIEYTGTEINQSLVDQATAKEIKVINASIEKLPFNDGEFDISHARHVIESLDNYEIAINELIRVSKHEVLIVFFITPTNKTTDNLIPYKQVELENTDYFLYLNRYSRPNMETFIFSNPRVKALEWETIHSYNKPNFWEAILHIYLQ